MELRHLRNFLTVVEQKSITRAAQIVRLAQPALSRQLIALENDFGVPLLVRRQSGVTPTPAGEILARHARSLLDQVQGVRDAVGASLGSPAGRLVVGIPTSMAATLMPDLARLVGETLPRVQLGLAEGYSASLRQRLLAGELDWALLYVDRRPSALVVRPVLKEPLVAIGARDAFAGLSSISMGDLAQRDPIVPGSANQLRAIFEEAASAAGIVARPSLEIDSVSAILELVSSGNRVSVLPYSTITTWVEQRRISYVPIKPEQLERRLVLARPAERLETPAWCAVVTILRDILVAKQPRSLWTVDQEFANLALV